MALPVMPTREEHAQALRASHLAQWGETDADDKDPQVGRGREAQRAQGAAASGEKPEQP